MAAARTDPLCRELVRTFRDRPFALEFWDGSRVPPTDDAAAPTLRFRSPGAISQLLRSPGQLGIGRAYVLGEARNGRPGRGGRPAGSLGASLAGRSTAAAARGGRRSRDRVAQALTSPSRRAACLAKAAHNAARRGVGPPSLRRLERVLRAVPRSLDDLQLRAVRGRHRDARGSAAGEAGADLLQARARAGNADARRRLRLGQPRDPRRSRAWRGGARGHAVGAPGGARRRASSSGRRRRPGEVSGTRLPRARGGALRRDRKHRDGRARRREPNRRLRGQARDVAAPERAAAQPRHHRMCPRRLPAATWAAPSCSATCFPTPSC